MQIRVPVSAGELLDKISILRIKAERIDDDTKQANVRHELELLQPECAHLGADDAMLQDWFRQLGEVNGQLWDIEDRIRECEAQQRFDEEFIGLARAVYRTNDERARIKREINRATGSDVVEEKSYKGGGS